MKIGKGVIDLWYYLKTDLYHNWYERTVAPDNYEDIYFAYHSYSKYMPKPRHFKNLDPELTPAAIVNHINNFIVNLEKLKSFS